MGDEPHSGSTPRQDIEDFDRSWSFGEAAATVMRQVIGLIAAAGAGWFAGVRYFDAEPSSGLASGGLKYTVPLALLAVYLAWDQAKAIYEGGLGRKPPGYLMAGAGQVAITCLLVVIAVLIALRGHVDLASAGQPATNWLLYGVVAGASIQAATSLGWFVLQRLRPDD